MELSHLPDYFRQEKFSDVDLVILADEQAEITEGEETEPPAKRARRRVVAGNKVLARFPAPSSCSGWHRLLQSAGTASQVSGTCKRRSHICCKLAVPHGVL